MLLSDAWYVNERYFVDLLLNFDYKFLFSLGHSQVYGSRTETALLAPFLTKFSQFDWFLDLFKIRVDARLREVTFLRIV